MTDTARRMVREAEAAEETHRRVNALLTSRIGEGASPAIDPAIGFVRRGPGRQPGTRPAVQVRQPTDKPVGLMMDLDTTLQLEEACRLDRSTKSATVRRAIRILSWIQQQQREGYRIALVREGEPLREVALL